MDVRKERNTKKMTFWETFWGVTLAVSMTKTAEILYDRWVRSHVSSGLEKLEGRASLLVRRNDEDEKPPLY